MLGNNWYVRVQLKTINDIAWEEYLGAEDKIWDLQGWAFSLFPVLQYFLKIN